ncbi:MAG TPA: DUF3151 family protein [Microbacteriaceae bacterium]|nr:DUF3151 family protein [Microbacteriaceae bacterium]
MAAGERGRQTAPAGEAHPVVLADEPAVREKVRAAGRAVQRLKAIAVAHPTSVLPWLALADVTFRADSPAESYAYARVAYGRALAALTGAGWRIGRAVPWSSPANRPALRAVFVLRRAAALLGLAGEERQYTALLRDADPEALGHLDDESPVPPAPPTETIVIRGLD